LLVEGDEEFDQGVVERFVFCISGSFDEGEEMGDEREREMT